MRRHRRSSKSVLYREKGKKTIYSLLLTFWRFNSISKQRFYTNIQSLFERRAVRISLYVTIVYFKLHGDFLLYFLLISTLLFLFNKLLVTFFFFEYKKLECGLEK